MTDGDIYKGDARDERRRMDRKPDKSSKKYQQAQAELQQKWERLAAATPCTSNRVESHVSSRPGKPPLPKAAPKFTPAPRFSAYGSLRHKDPTPLFIERTADEPSRPSSVARSPSTSRARHRVPSHIVPPRKKNPDRVHSPASDRADVPHEPLQVERARDGYVSFEAEVQQLESRRKYGREVRSESNSKSSSRQGEARGQVSEERDDLFADRNFVDRDFSEQYFAHEGANNFPRDVQYEARQEDAAAAMRGGGRPPKYGESFAETTVRRVVQERRIPAPTFTAVSNGRNTLLPADPQSNGIINEDVRKSQRWQVHSPRNAQAETNMSPELIETQMSDPYAHQEVSEIQNYHIDQVRQRDFIEYSELQMDSESDDSLAGIPHSNTYDFYIE